MQHVIRPQAHPAVSTGNREVDTLLHQPPPHPKATRGRLDQQQTQLRNVIRLSNQEDAPDPLTIPLGDPASLGRWIEILHEIQRDLLNKIAKAVIPPVLLGVDLAVPPDYPLDIVGRVGAKNEIRL